MEKINEISYKLSTDSPQVFEFPTVAFSVYVLYMYIQEGHFFPLS